MRAHVRHGYTRADLIAMQNERFFAEVEARGIKMPWPIFTVAQGFQQLARAHWHRYYRCHVLREHLGAWQRAEHLRNARDALAKTRQCDRPKLPG